MEVRPDRFKVVAAKTLGKIYGYVKKYIYLGKIIIQLSDVKVPKTDCALKKKTRGDIWV